MIRKGNVRNAEAGRCFGKQKKKWKKKKKKRRENETKQAAVFLGFGRILL